MKINKKLGKVIAIIMILSVFVMSFAPLVLATTSAGAVNPKDSFTPSTDDAVTKDVKTFGGKLVSVISTVGSIGAIIFLIILGLKYMMGSAEERAEYKKTLMPYFIGAIMVFGASALAGIIFNIAQGIGTGA